MCVMIVQDVPSRGNGWRPVLEIPFLAETLRYRQNDLTVQFDVVLRNPSGGAVGAFFIHDDNVEGALSTDHWSAEAEKSNWHVNGHVNLIRRIFGNDLAIDGKGFAYRDSSTISIPNESLRAILLTSSGEPRYGRLPIDTSCLHEDQDFSKTPVSLKKWVCDESGELVADISKPHSDSRPFSAFRIASIPPYATVFARLTIHVADNAYRRLVPPPYSSLSSLVTSSRRVAHGIQTMLSRFRPEPQNGPYRRFFEKFVTTQDVGNGQFDRLASVIEPDHYFIIFAQPGPEYSQDSRVVAQPTSGDISEIFVEDLEANRRSQLFRALSQDFSLHIEFSENRVAETHGSLRSPAIA